MTWTNITQVLNIELVEHPHPPPPHLSWPGDAGSISNLSKPILHLTLVALAEIGDLKVGAECPHIKDATIRTKKVIRRI